MRPALLPVLALAAVACRPSTSREASAPAPQAATPPAPKIQPTAQQTECVERWLKGHGLDTYGNPQGTMYAGGTPTFDEATGKSVDRWTLVAKNRPEALQSCSVPVPP